jgi:ubiquinone/menaquinone biosynthesis C-methylase UbiE
MQRTPEPELMNEQEQAAAYAAEDWSEAHGKIPPYFRERFPDFKSGRVIDLGCGPADVTIRFVKAFPQVTVVGVDGSEAMLSFGRKAVSKEGLDSRITLEKRFIPDPSIETKSFDAAISNSLLHHLADPSVLWHTCKLAVKPGSPVLIVDLVRPRDPEAAARLVKEHAQGAPPVLERDFVASLHAAYTVDEVRRQITAAGLPHFKVDHVDELHFVAWGRM